MALLRDVFECRNLVVEQETPVGKGRLIHISTRMTSKYVSSRYMLLLTVLAILCDASRSLGKA